MKMNMNILIGPDRRDTRVNRICDFKPINRIKVVVVG